ncbi:hypothetical protein IWX62_000193 [Arthrobacter sp. CAN_A1]
MPTFTIRPCAPAEVETVLRMNNEAEIRMVRGGS